MDALNLRPDCGDAADGRQRKGLTAPPPRRRSQRLWDLLEGVVTVMEMYYLDAPPAGRPARARAGRRRNRNGRSRAGATGLRR